MSRGIGVAAIAVAIGIAAGCGGKSEQQKAAEAAAQAAQSAGQAAQGGAGQAAQSLQQLAQGLQSGQPPAKLVDFEELKALLPEVSGWERKARGEQVSMGIASVSRAEATYTSGDKQIQLEITDAALNQLILTPFSMFIIAGFSERSDEGYTKAITVGGQPGFEKWNKDSKNAEVTAIVANRFIVKGEGNDVENADVVRKVVESVNLSKLAGLK